MVWMRGRHLSHSRILNLMSCYYVRGRKDRASALQATRANFGTFRLTVIFSSFFRQLIYSLRVIIKVIFFFLLSVTMFCCVRKIMKWRAGPDQASPGQLSTLFESIILPPPSSFSMLFSTPRLFQHACQPASLPACQPLRSEWSERTRHKQAAPFALGCDDQARNVPPAPTFNLNLPESFVSCLKFYRAYLETPGLTPHGLHRCIAAPLHHCTTLPSAHLLITQIPLWSRPGLLHVFVLIWRSSAQNSDGRSTTSLPDQEPTWHPR